MGESTSCSVVLAVLCAMAAGCGSPTTQSAAISSPSSGAGDEVARSVVDALMRNGLQPGRPVDTSATECPKIGCLQAISTPRMQIFSFPTSGSAQLYAADHGMRQVESVVVEFSPSVGVAERQTYWAAITGLMT